MVRDEGAQALWRGNTANVLRLFPTQAFNFGWRTHFKTLFNYHKEDGYAKWFMANLASRGAAGELAGDCVLARLCSNAACKRRQECECQAYHWGPPVQSLMDVYKKTLATDGVAGLYRGFAVSTVGIVVYRGLCKGLVLMILSRFVFFLLFYLSHL